MGSWLTRAGPLALALLLGVVAVFVAWRLPLLRSSSGVAHSPTFSVAPTLLPRAAAGANVFPDGDSHTGGLGQPIMGLTCNPEEMTKVHAHVHLSLFVEGKRYAIPSQVGVVQRPSGGACIYEIHTHDASGTIHVESMPGTFQLGELFKIWGEPLSRNAVGPYRGHVFVYVNGMAFNADPREIPLAPHQQVVLEVGSRLVRPPTFTFPFGE